MKKLIVSLTILTGFVYMNGPLLEACGAKFLVSTRSPRHPKAKRATTPAAILLYQHSNEAPVVEFFGQVQDTLTGVGHKVTLVTNEAALRDAAGSERSNVVIMQLDAARRLRGDLSSRSRGAAILPVKAFVTRAEAVRVKEEFGQMLTLPTTDRNLLSVVENSYR